MHPEIAKTLIAQRHDDLMRDTARSRRGSGRRRFPRWHVSWSRTVLAPAGPSAAASSGWPGRASRRGRSLVIIISAHRSA